MKTVASNDPVEQPEYDPEFEQMCKDFAAACCNDNSFKANAGTTGLFGGFFNGALARILAGLREAGVSAFDFWTWIPIILQLITTLGPKIQEIIKLILDAIRGGETPKTFNVASAVAAYRAEAAPA